MSSYPSSPQFLVELKTVTEWYLLGVHLGVPTQDLDDINTRFGPSQGAKVCLAKVYEKYKDQHGSPSWEVILKALKEIDKITLADDISKKYPSQESGSTQSISDSESDGSIDDGLDYDAARVFIHNEVKVKFDSLRIKYSKVVLSVKKALKAESVDIDDLQGVIQDHCGLQPLPSESATLDSVFQRMKQAQHVSCFDVSLLMNVADVFVEQACKKVEEFCKELNKFKSSTLMKQIVEDVKEKRRSPAGSKAVTLKVSQAWNNATMRDFERLVNIVLHEEQLSLIQAKKGCMCITWVATDVKVGEIVQS